MADRTKTGESRNAGASARVWAAAIGVALGFSTPALGQESAGVTESPTPHCVATFELDWSQTRASKDDILWSLRVLHAQFEKSELDGTLLVHRDLSRVFAIASDCEIAERIRQFAIENFPSEITDIPTIKSAPSPEMRITSIRALTPSSEQAGEAVE